MDVQSILRFANNAITRLFSQMKVLVALLKLTIALNIQVICLRVLCAMEKIYLRVLLEQNAFNFKIVYSKVQLKTIAKFAKTTIDCRKMTAQFACLSSKNAFNMKAMKNVWHVMKITSWQTVCAWKQIRKMALKNNKFTQW